MKLLSTQSFVLVLAVCNVCSVVAKTKPFKKGDKLELHCLDPSDGKFKPSLVCAETNKAITFTFGVDEFTYCGWQLKTKEMYDKAVSYIKQKDALQCRIPMSKDGVLYLPVVIPLFGLVERTHIHINYHMNFVFHVDEGRVIGASFYPVRDRLQLGKVGSVINFHGPVRWFNRHSYTLIGAVPQSAPLVSFTTVTLLGWITLTACVSFILSIMFYKFILRPRLVKRLLKAD